MSLAPNGEPRADPRPAVVIYRAPLFNASETFVRAHVEALTRYRPLLAGLEDKGHVPPALRDALFVPRGAFARTAARLGATGALARRLRAEHPRLVHAHFGPDGLAALPLARRLGVPLVVTLHGYDVSRTDARLWLSGRLSWMRYAAGRARLARGAALFLAVSEAVRQAAVARGFPAERTRTHHLGIDLTRFVVGREREPDLVLHVGRLVEKKGTAVLLDALARLPNARLVIVGDGPERGALERQAAPLGPRVRFLGNLPPAEVAQWMQRAALLAAPSVTARDGDAEGLPTVIVEAAACGLPTVATHHSGIPEAIDDGTSGFLVPERDAEALAARIALLLESGERRAQMGAAARAWAEQRFDLAQQTAKLEAIYDGLLTAPAG